MYNWDIKEVDKMHQSLKIVRVNTKYCDYLRKFDHKVPYNKNEKELRPFLGYYLK